MKRLAMIVFFVLAFTSCKKDKLIGEKSVIIGTWSWTTTNHNYGWCEGDDLTETITPESEGNDYSMQFLEKGIVKYYVNDELIEKDRLHFSAFENSSGIFSFELNLKHTGLFSAIINENTMLVARGFPFENAEEGCEIYTSYFTRE